MFKKIFSKKKAPIQALEPEKPSGAPVIPKNYEDLKEMGFNHTQALMSFHLGTWRMELADRYDLDLATGEINWLFPDRTVRAPAQLLGTWSNQDETFLWGWDHPSAPNGTAIAAKALKGFADENNIQELQNRKQACDFEGGWSLAAMAVLVGDLQGIYRFQASETAWVYVGFGEIVISKD